MLNRKSDFYEMWNNSIHVVFRFVVCISSSIFLFLFSCFAKFFFLVVLLINQYNVNRYFPSIWGPVHTHQLQWRTKILGTVIGNFPSISVKYQICWFSVICTSVTIWIPRMTLPFPPHSKQCWDKQTLVVSWLFNILICMDGAKTLHPNETLSNFFCLFYCSSFQMVEALIPFLMRPTDFIHLSHTTLEWKSLQCWTTWSWFRWSTLLQN